MENKRDGDDRVILAAEFLLLADKSTKKSVTNAMKDAGFIEVEVRCSTRAKEAAAAARRAYKGMKEKNI
jgi:hypothetical protein